MIPAVIATVLDEESLQVYEIADEGRVYQVTVQYMMVLYHWYIYTIRVVYEGMVYEGIVYILGYGGCGDDVMAAALSSAPVSDGDERN